MSKKIEWLDSFAEKYAKEMKKTAGKVEKLDVIVDRADVKNAKVGEVINFKGKLYKVADLDFEDDMGPGVVLNEVGPEVPTSDPMSMSMGTEVSGLTNAGKEQEYARTNPGDVYHYEVRDDVEQPAFEQAAAETASEIEKERAFDRSTVPGHYTAPKDMGGAAPIGESVVPETDSVPVDVVEEPVIEEPVAEEPVTEEPVVEEPVEEETIEEEPVEEEEPIEEEKTEIVGRHNRILRRIMASK